MSNLDREAVPALCGGRGFVVAEPVRELLSPRRVKLGESTEVRRLLPNLGRRMIGAWCFVDHYGPDDIADEPGMQVPPHPHMGLQTVSWLHEGEVLHRDSTGSLQTIRPRELGLMTSGRAISHSEESPKPHARFLHGAQLWVALPDSHRHTDPHFEHHAELPLVTAPGLEARLILGTVDGTTSPGTTYTPIVGADLSLAHGADVRLPLEPDFEYAVLSMSGEVHVDGVPVLPGSMLYLGCGRTELPCAPSRTRPSCSWAASRSRRSWSCGGTSSAVRSRKSKRAGRTGWRALASAKCTATMAPRCPLPNSRRSR